ncbi:MAG: peptidyl-prolyl cis-trans isomerase [Smithellaceae bacterium]
MDKAAFTFIHKHWITASRACAAGCLVALCLTTACNREDMLSRDHVATVNGEKIYLDEYQQRLDTGKAQYKRRGLIGPSHNMKRLEEEILDAMITQKIIDLRARERGITVTNTELERKAIEIRSDYADNFFNLLISENVRYDDWKEELRNDILLKKLIAEDVNAGIRVSEDEAEDYYNEFHSRYKTEASVHVAQIVVRDREQAEEIKAALDTGADFAGLAAKVSIGPEAKSGGDLGPITRGIMPEPLDETIFRLPAGAISDVVQSPYGYHIIRIVDIQPPKSRTFAEAKNDVMAEIRARKEEAAFTLWIEGLRMKAEIKKEPTVLREKVKR